MFVLILRRLIFCLYRRIISDVILRVCLIIISDILSNCLAPTWYSQKILSLEFTTSTFHLEFVPLEFNAKILLLMTKTGYMCRRVRYVIITISCLFLLVFLSCVRRHPQTQLISGIMIPSRLRLVIALCISSFVPACLTFQRPYVPYDYADTWSFRSCH